MCISMPAIANAKQSITLDPGDAALFARAGAVQVHKDWTWIVDGGLRIGLPWRLELATPLAVAFAPLRRRPFEISFTAGITDFWPISWRRYLYTPAVVASARIHLSHEAAALFSVDFTHIQENRERGPGFIRGGGALMVNMGPRLTWCIGVSYQHIVVDRPLPDALPRSGMAGRDRVSIGSIRVTPFADVPLFSIHTHKRLDITFNARVDIDTEHTNTRIEGGMLIHW